MRLQFTRQRQQLRQRWSLRRKNRESVIGIDKLYQAVAKERMVVNDNNDTDRACNSHLGLLTTPESEFRAPTGLWNSGFWLATEVFARCLSTIAAIDLCAANSRRLASLKVSTFDFESRADGAGAIFHDVQTHSFCTWVS